MKKSIQKQKCVSLRPKNKKDKSLKYLFSLRRYVKEKYEILFNFSLFPIRNIIGTLSKFSQRIFVQGFLGDIRDQMKLIDE